MRILIKALLFTLITAAVWAQPTATIVGRVVDASGATVSGAQVTARNVDTGLERSTSSTESGDYELALLPITGSYTVSISKQGFQTQQLNGIQLQVDQRARVDVQLTLGSISEKVQVEAVAPILNTETGSIGQVIENKQIVELP